MSYLDLCPEDVTREIYLATAKLYYTHVLEELLFRTEFIRKANFDVAYYPCIICYALPRQITEEGYYWCYHWCYGRQEQKGLNNIYILRKKCQELRMPETVTLNFFGTVVHIPRIFL
jgi:hypothetical protein